MDLRCISTFTSHLSKHSTAAVAIPNYSSILKSSHRFTATSWRPPFKSKRLSRAKASAASQSYDGDSNESKNDKCALSMNDEDSDWPDEEEGGWGFQLSEFFNEVRIVNKRPEDDLDYLTEDEIQWQDDSVKAASVKGIRTDEWEDSVFGDVAPLVVLIYERYNRPIENMKARVELDKAIHVFWDLKKPAPRAVMINAAEETELASALHVKETPVTLFFKDGKLLYRQTDILMADDLAKVMAHVFWGANPPECLKGRRVVEEKAPYLA